MNLTAAAELKEGDPGASVAVIGAGPCGLFQVFELGLLGIQAHVFDSLKMVGGQCAELYPDKPIYDIPALPICGAQELVDRLMQQIHPFNPQFHLGEAVATLLPDGAGGFKVGTAGGFQLTVGAVVIAAGLGAFQPRRLGVPGAEAFEGNQIQYRVRDAQRLAGQRIVVFGGGDSALDWAVALAPTAQGLTLVHRREQFRGAPATVARVRELQAAGRIQHFEGIADSLLTAGDALQGVRIKGNDGRHHELHADQILVFFGLHPKLGPIAEWGLALERKAIAVDTEKFQTSVPGIFAIGDINTYPGKKKLILSGFHEAALAAFGIQHHLFPRQKQFLQYTTTSPIMHRRLGVPDT
ncbi:MAG TPA: NAD(P)/FAD-dependent oxidoreductase [Steroidobacteraceae bacterium]|jgi:thioredoxin reductase (NADPH)